MTTETKVAWTETAEQLRERVFLAAVDKGFLTDNRELLSVQIELAKLEQLERWLHLLTLRAQKDAWLKDRKAGIAKEGEHTQFCGTTDCPCYQQGQQDIQNRSRDPR